MLDNQQLKAQLSNARVYTDFSGLNSLKNAAKTPDSKTAKEVSQQFEGIFLQMALDSMRKAGQAFESDISKSSAVGFYQGMFDSQVALQLAGKSNLGFATAIEKQINSQNKPVTTDSKLPLNTLPEKLLGMLRNLPGVSGTSASQSANLSPATTTSITSTEPSSTTTQFATPADFIRGLWQMAKQHAGELGVQPAVLLAQAALETGWGKHVIQDDSGQSSHNLFNIKAGGSNHAATQVASLEYQNGQMQSVQSGFRTYDSYADSFADYVQLVKNNPRYQVALQQSAEPHAYMRALAKAGYATDPHYADKVMNLMKSAAFQDATKEMENMTKV